MIKAGPSDVRNKYKHLIESLYMNRYLWKLGNEESLYYKPLNEVIKTYVVNDYARSIRDNVGREFTDCRVKSVGSSEDGTQVGIPREFDFIFELHDIASLVKGDRFKRSRFEIIPTNIPLTGPQQNPQVKPRTYINWKIVNQEKSYATSSGLSSPWGEFGNDQDIFLLDPAKLQVTFKKSIEYTLKYHPKTASRPYEIILRGPAVCVYLYIKTSDILSQAKNSCAKDSLKLLRSIGQELCVKMDFVLGIAFNVLDDPEKSNSLCIGTQRQIFNINDAMLTHHAAHLKKCHLVVSGTYFHISLSLFETEAVRYQISQENPQSQVKGNCIRAIKVNITLVIPIIKSYRVITSK